MIFLGTTNAPKTNTIVFKIAIKISIYSINVLYFKFEAIYHSPIIDIKFLIKNLLLESPIFNSKKKKLKKILSYRKSYYETAAEIVINTVD